MTAVIVFAHGSTVESANEACRAVTQELARQCRLDLTETAFLDCAPPGLRQAVESVITRGATKVVVVPYFLTLGIHLQRDLPALVQEVNSTHPGIPVHVTPPLDGHPALLEIVKARTAEALQGEASASTSH